jgi:hypothetical protein
MPRPASPTPPLPRGLSRAARYGYPAAAIVCAATAACEPSRPTEAPTQTATPPRGGEDAAVAASSGSGAAGATCKADTDCVTGLSCCASGMSGKCGGAQQAGVQYPPCVITSTCSAPPCHPLPMPPYGCVFPDACGAVFV